MNDWLAGGAPKNPKLPSKLLAYVLRMSTRTTPFGTFAGVADVASGTRQTLELRSGGWRRVRLRPDAAWLQRRIAPLFADPERRDALRVVPSDAYRERNGRIFVTSLHDGDSERVSIRSPASIRKTAAVEIALDLCERGAGHGDLIAGLAERFAVAPHVPRRLVNDMWECGLLVPELRPPPLVSALDHVIAHLPETERDLRRALDADRAQLRRLSAAQSLDEREVVDVVRAMRASAEPVDHVLQADSSVALDGTLHANVLSEAAQLGSLLLRNGGSLRLREFEDAWQRRFDSPGVVVPLLEALDPDIGLGDPRLLEIAWDKRADGDDIRLAAVAEALRSGSEEIVLTADDCARWFPAEPDAAMQPATMDVAFAVIAANAAAVDDGDFLIAATPMVASPAGRLTGRFSDLVPATIERLRSALRTSDDDAAVRAELVYAPAHGRGANVSTRAPIYPYAIALGVHIDAPQRIGLRDLFVGRDERGFFLVSQALGKRVIPHESHAMAIPRDAPPVWRFLTLLARQHFTPSPFAWGAAAEHMPALPRVRAGRIILSPRRWRLPAELFTGAAADAVHAIRVWRERWNCPAHVRFGEADLLLPVNLDRPEFIALIRDVRGKNAAAPLVVYEIVETASTAVVRDATGAHAAEFVAALATRVTGSHAPAPAGSKPPVLGMPPQFGLASDYAYVKLYCAAHRIDRAIAAVAPALEALIDAGLADRWFFIRYADPEPHLRVRAHAAGDAGALRAQLFAHTEEWLHGGWFYRVAADTYLPETSRYGGIDALPLIERIFMESSRACCAALTPAPDGVRDRMRRGALTALELFAPLVRRLGMTWWLDVFADRGPPRDRLFREDRAAIAAASASIGEGGTAGSLDALLDTVAIGDAAAIVPALLHMHLNRMGVAPADEAIVRDLIRACYVSSIARMRMTMVTRDT
jgi:thiopeptide-type bacteriocin biosynthesis protein